RWKDHVTARVRARAEPARAADHVLTGAFPRALVGRRAWPFARDARRLQQEIELVVVAPAAAEALDLVVRLERLERVRLTGGGAGPVPQPEDVADRYLDGIAVQGRGEEEPAGAEVAGRLQAEAAVQLTNRRVDAARVVRVGAAGDEDERVRVA